MSPLVTIPAQQYADEFYIDAARSHPAFQQMAASAAIEGIYFSVSQTVEAGRYIVNEIDYEQWSQIISKRHGLP
jgi:hypothetical protein